LIITKQKIARLLRRFHLLKLADNIMLLMDILKNRKYNQIFLSEHPDFVPPPYSLAYDTYNHTNWGNYYNMGLRHSTLIADLIREYISENEIKICEWGCGPGRVIRHLDKINGFGKVELFGTDYNKKSIEWCKENIKNAHFGENSLEPPLPLENNSFDCVYALSIFTHLSEKMHHAWLEELFRIIKPNGILIFTTHGDLYAKRLLPSEKAIYNSGCLVIIDKVKEGTKHFAAYHPPQFIKTKLLKNYVILKHIKHPESYQLEQDVWIAKKKS